jgi:two-component system, sensor histidine kinase
MADANAALVESRRDLETKSIALVAAKEDLRALAEKQNQNKSKFLADAAHDLSQPVHAVSLLIESARYALERRDRRKSAALMDAAGRAARLTRSSFKAVLEISQLESGLIRPTYSVFDVEELIAEVAAPLRVIAEARGVTVRLRRSQRISPIVRSDRALLGRAIANLLSNAIKYADPAKGDRRAVLVGAISLSQHVRIDVVDNGIGIPSDRRADVFQPFVQLSNPERNREKGLGLGLSIVAATVDLLARHKITMRSVEGRGTRVSLETPRHAGRRGLVTQAQAAAGGSGDLTSLFIWCVEDDEMNREATLALLNELGVLTDQAGSVEQLEHALERTERAPDLVISDYRLPQGRTADDVVAAFSRRWSEPIPVLVLTGEVAASGALIARNRTLFLKKPAAPEAFIAAIHQLCFSPGDRLEPAATVPAATPPRSS